MVAVLRGTRTTTAERGFQLAHSTGAGHAIAALLPGETAHRIAASGIPRGCDRPDHSECGNRYHGSNRNRGDLCSQLK
jgi:hypothetical protein